MLIDMILTTNANIKIKEVKQAQQIILNCEDETEYYCPRCGSFHLRCKDTFERHIKGISVGGRATLLCLKTHKYCCKDCGCYFNSTPQGLLKYQQSM